jgi:hypothetical protein
LAGSISGHCATISASGSSEVFIAPGKMSGALLELLLELLLLLLLELLLLLLLLLTAVTVVVDAFVFLAFVVVVVEDVFVSPA